MGEASGPGKFSWEVGNYEQRLDNLNSKMKVENRSILLLIDNCSAHPYVI